MPSHYYLLHLERMSSATIPPHKDKAGDKGGVGISPYVYTLRHALRGDVGISPYVYTLRHALRGDVDISPYVYTLRHALRVM